MIKNGLKMSRKSIQVGRLVELKFVSVGEIAPEGIDLNGPEVWRSGPLKIY
jgi:hypothetical protein